MKAELRDGVDVDRIGHLFQADRADQHAGQQESRDAGNLQACEDHAEDTGCQQADADIVNQRRHFATGGPG